MASSSIQLDTYIYFTHIHGYSNIQSCFNVSSASEKKNFLGYYAVPLQHHLPQVFAHHLMLLVVATHRLLKGSISSSDREDAASVLKLFCAQASALYGMPHLGSLCVFNIMLYNRI